MTTPKIRHRKLCRLFQKKGLSKHQSKSRRTKTSLRKKVRFAQAMGHVDQSGDRQHHRRDRAGDREHIKGAADRAKSAINDTAIS